MTIEELMTQSNQCMEEMEKLNLEIMHSEPELIEEYETLSTEETIPSTPSTISSNTSSQNNNYTLRDPNGNTINASDKYDDGTTFEYNGITYIYRKDYGAFVRTQEPLCTKENVSQYMIPKSILETINSNVIVEFNQNGITSDEALTKVFGTSYKNDIYLGTSEKGEIPITRIYNIDHGINKVQFELNQYWAGEKNPIGASFGDNKFNTVVNGCLVFSLINSLNAYDAQEQYDNASIFSFLEGNVKTVLSPFKNENQGIVINDITKLQNITSAAQITHVDSRGKGEALDEDKVYVVHVDTDNGGRIRTTGGHYVMLMPAGDGNCYIVDSNNSLIRSHTPNNDPYFIPYMTYEEAINALKVVKGRGQAVAWDIT